MKILVVLLSLLMSVNFAHGRWVCPYEASELTDEALISQVEAIVDELEANSHDQKTMNMAYNRSRVIRKKTNRYLNRLPRLKDATDEDILPLLQDIVTNLETLEHRTRKLAKIKKHLNKILWRLENNRETPVEVAVLAFDNDDPLNFGSLFLNLNTIIPINVTNSGNGDAVFEAETGMTGDFSFGSVPYPGDLGTCGAVIPAGTTCQISVEFKPQVVGPATTELIIEYNDGGMTQTLTKELQGTGV